MEQLKIVFSNLGPNSILDIAIIYFVIYKAYMLIRDMRAKQLVKGMTLLLVTIPVAKGLQLTAVSWILENTFQVGIIALVVIFQPELRRALEHIGRTSFSFSNLERNSATSEYVIKEIVSATTSLARQKIGALIIFEKKTGLNDIVDTGTRINGDISSGLLINIFIPNTPLHDGAVIVKDYTVLAAGCFLPLTDNNELNKEIGTRHRAAIGMTERSDAVALVVSEETGYISYAVDGRLYRNIQPDELEQLLSNMYADNGKTTLLEKWRYRNEDKK